MSTRSGQFESKMLATVADDYRQRGYRVRVEPEPSSLPPELRGYQVDLVASRGTENVIVEVKIGGKGDSITRQLAELTEQARAIGWRVDLVSEPESEGSVWPRAKRESLLRSALGLLDEGQREACVLLAFAAMEGTLAALAGRHRSLPDRVVPARQLLASLDSYGVIGPKTSRRLMRFSDARNHVAHGQSMGHYSARDVRESVENVLWLNDPGFVSPDDMVDWFFTVYEDPAEWVPYETREGGYIYPSGEPHDAFEVLQEEYEAASMDAIEDAAALIAPLGAEWVRRRASQP